MATFGHPSKFGYKDMCRLFMAPKFDQAQADRLVELYKKVGARYVVPVAVDHDNFDMWDSKYQPRWNSVVTSGKHVVGMWRKAVDKHGLRLGVASHVARTYRWFQPSHRADGSGPLAGVPYDGQNPEFADLYGVKWKDTGSYPDFWYEQRSDVGPPEFEKNFEGRMKDLMDKYHPDLYYTEGGIPFKQAGLNVLAHFYNETVAIQLAVAAVSETIEVVGIYDDVINPNRTGSSSSVALEQIEMFPTVRRNLLDIAKTNPCASIRAGDENQKDISFAGRSSKYNNIQIDGSNYNDLFGLGEGGGTPSGQANAQPIQLDALAELQVSVSPYDVRQGGFTGGAINAVTRSGSNDFHGSAYYAQRDPDYVGDGPSDTPIKDFDEEQFGASLGGRIISDKLFFFVAGELKGLEPEKPAW